MFSRDDLASDPFRQFEQWLNDALAEKRIEQPYAMTLATATSVGTPSARMVLLRGFDERGFVFYTNYDSQKSQELAQNPQAALVFYWATLDRQIRVTGQVERVSASESNNYFAGRPRGSQLGAWASEQSQIIESRAILENKLKGLEVNYEDQLIPRPPFWGGFRVAPLTIDFWESCPNRLHDWFRYQRQSEGNWLLVRLSP
jgi:pyridoxamine 5'-phosphate oxidase